MGAVECASAVVAAKFEGSRPQPASRAKARETTSNLFLHEPLVICPDFITIRISQRLPAARSDFPREIHSIGLVRATVSGLLTQFSGDHVTLSDNIVLRAAHGPPGLEKFHVGSEVVRVVSTRQGKCVAGEFISVSGRSHVLFLH